MKDRLFEPPARTVVETLHVSIDEADLVWTQAMVSEAMTGHLEAAHQAEPISLPWLMLAAGAVALVTVLLLHWAQKKGAR